MRQPTGQEWASINDAFDRLVDQAPERQERLLVAGGYDPYVATRVRAMLASHNTVGVLDTMSPLLPGEGIDPGYSSLKQDDVVGAFRIARLIGRGGMGEVYLADRVEGGFDQRIAVKLLRPEAAGRMELFDAERQLLARLEHPGIARLIDGGLAVDGRPYMALEYVDGEAITHWCAAHGSSLADRLRLFLDLCDAVGYAHARGVIHRDIKPANILVDSEGRARLLDFGVARIIDAASPEQTITQAMLTPDYAAPEQFRRDQPTVATDIYALGGILFELLSGRGAWLGEGNALPATIRRMVDEEPPLPSKLAAQVATAPVSPARIAGDLDAIVMKAMRHDPAARYASVAALADDVRRHLAFEPVQARSGSTAYQFRRFVRRHRWAVAAGAALLFALLVGAGGVAWQSRQTAIERDIAKAEARRAEAVNESMSLMFRNAQEFGKGGSASAQDLLNDSTARLIQSFGERSPNTAPVVNSLAELYLQIEDLVGAETLLSTAIARGVGREDPAQFATMQMNLGSIQGATGKFDAATKLLDQSDKVWRTDPERFRNERLESGAARAQIMRQMGKRDEAIKLLIDEMPEAERAYADEPRSLLIRYNNLAVHLGEADRLVELDRVLKRAEVLLERSHMEKSPIGISLIQQRGSWYTRKDDQRAALRYFRRAAELRRSLYGPSAGLATDLLQVTRVMLGVGEIRQAIPIIIEARQMAEQYAGAGSPITIMLGVSLGEAQAHEGDIAEARKVFAELEPGLKELGTQNLIYGAYLRGRFQLHLMEGDFPAARADLDAAEKLFKTIGAPAAPFTRSIPLLRDALKRAEVR
ncbi:serine/threonine protein kinase/predicted negative regulator of RcsB-dependent stress response [Sphingomonas sp. UYAg733]